MQITQNITGKTYKDNKTNKANVPLSRYSGEHSDSPKNSSALLKGKILDLNQVYVTILSHDGAEIKGKPLNVNISQIGQNVLYSVQKRDGHIYFDIMTEEQAESQKNLFSNILKGIGLKDSADNFKMLQSMIDNNLPLNKDSILKFNQAIKLLGKDNIQDAVFFINNDIRAGLKNSTMLAGYKNDSVSLPKQLEALSNLLKNLHLDTNLVFAPANNVTLEDTSPVKNIPMPQNPLPVKNILMIESSSSAKNTSMLENPSYSKNTPIQESPFPAKNISVPSINNIPVNNMPVFNKHPFFSENLFINQNIATPSAQSNMSIPHVDVSEINTPEPQPENQTLNKNSDIPIITKLVQKNLLFDFISSTPLDLDKFFNDLQQAIKESKLSAAGTPNETAVHKTADDIVENLKFMNQINTVTYAQIPALINQSPTNVELYVFNKDDKNKKSKPKDTGSALISLKLPALGLFEVYVQRDHKSVNCQFRIQNTYIESLVKTHIHELNNHLSALNYSLDNIQFKHIAEKFTVVDNEPNLGDNADLLKHQDKRITFDMRT